MGNKNTLFAVLGVLVIAAVAIGFIVFRHAPAPVTKLPENVAPVQKQPEKLVVPLEVKTQEVPVTKAPQSFPSAIPIEQGAKITQNYNATAPNGMFQATRVFETGKSLDENFTLYNAFLKSDGWTLTNTVDQPTAKLLSAKKDQAQLQISMTENSVTKVREIDISYSEQK